MGNQDINAVAFYKIRNNVFCNESVFMNQLLQGKDQPRR